MTRIKIDDPMEKIRAALIDVLTEKTRRVEFMIDNLHNHTVSCSVYRCSPDIVRVEFKEKR